MSFSSSFSTKPLKFNMREQKGLRFSVMLNVLWCFCFICLSHALDTLKPGDRLYNNATLVSAGGVFELGFFVPDELSNQYLGIWFKKDKTKKAVWVANRDSPLRDSYGVLKIRKDGNMVISDARLSEFIVNTGSLATSSNTSAILDDSGNLILMEGETIVWQSFDYPTDTFLPGMKLGWFDLDTNRRRVTFLLSWLNPSLPASGHFALGLDSANTSRFNVLYKSERREIGFWDGHSFRFLFQSSSDGYNFSFVSNEKDVYLTFNNTGNIVSSCLVLTSSGVIQEYTVTEEGIFIVNHSLCDSVSVVNSKDCFKGLPLTCEEEVLFSEFTGSLHNLTIVSEDSGLAVDECETICRSNCSCTAFASSGDGGIGCQFYYGDKVNVLSIIGKGNSTIFVRGTTTAAQDSRHRRWARLWFGIVVLVVSLILSMLIAWRCSRWRNGPNGPPTENQEVNRSSLGLFPFPSSSEAINTADAGNAANLGLSAMTDNELPLLSFSSVARATNNFSPANKLGEGGFGPVYKGKLLGQEIAVKRLSISSGQGLEEFKTEVQLISKLQHRNLVLLVACCIDQGEKILIYEYMPNRSLDSFIFDSVKRNLLNWRQRVHIIEGIAQGLLYLHKYSRLRIIHRDLKTSNILLDGHMNPKISDFGMARIFSDNESHAQTKRVVGTYGYMSPEYGVHGLFSTKSDVYSFGVILLEILSGRKNIALSDIDSPSNLVGHAWEIWKAERFIDFMDPVLANSFSMQELILCVQVGLLCVQDNAEDRPTMSDVVSILTSEEVVLPPPKQPSFSTQLNTKDAADSSRRLRKPSFTAVTFSAIDPR